jgi:hypothetical protein
VFDQAYHGLEGERQGMRFQGGRTIYWRGQSALLALVWYFIRFLLPLRKGDTGFVDQ